MQDEAKDMTFNARQVQGILENAEVGCHALFEAGTIRRALNASVAEVELDDSTVTLVQGAIVELAGMESVMLQREYIDTLTEPVQNLLVHLYFRFLDQFMHRRSVTIH